MDEDDLNRNISLEEAEMGKCEWCTTEGELFDNEGTMICEGCIDSEIERLDRLREE